MTSTASSPSGFLGEFQLGEGGLCQGGLCQGGLPVLDVEYHLNVWLEETLADLSSDLPQQRSPQPSPQPPHPNVDAVTGTERVRANRRTKHKKTPEGGMLSAEARACVPDECFLDNISLPTTSTGTLDLSRVEREVSRGPSSISTLVLTRDRVVAGFNGGQLLANAGSPVIPIAAGSFEEVRGMFGLMVGCLFPAMGQIREPSRDAKNDGAFRQNSLPITEESRHAFAFRPVIIATNGDGDSGDSGEILAQGVIVSNKALNYAVGDPRRLTLGGKPDFEEAVCMVLITHVYTGIDGSLLTYAALGPPGVQKVVRDGEDVYAVVSSPSRNHYESVFRWEDHMRLRTAQPQCGVSSFVLTDSKQTGRDMIRKLYSGWSLDKGQAILESMRRNDMLENHLLHVPMSIGSKRGRGVTGQLAGIDVRRFLLAELLLVGTPLEPLLRGEPVEFSGFPPCPVPAELAEALRIFSKAWGFSNN